MLDWREAGKRTISITFILSIGTMRFAPEEVGVKVVNSCYQVVDE